MLKYYRMENTDFTQQDMATFLKMSLSNYQRVERLNNCPLNVAHNISILFNDTIENIFFK